MSPITETIGELLSIASYAGAGFAPLARFGAWRVAISNALADEELHVLQRHLQTDESFVLLAGTGAMLVAEGEAEVGTAHWVVMEPLKVYTVRRNCWHAHRITAGSSLLIVENEDTGDANSVTYRLTDSERQLLLQARP